MLNFPYGCLKETFHYVMETRLRHRLTVGNLNFFFIQYPPDLTFHKGNLSAVKKMNWVLTVGTSDDTTSRATKFADLLAHRPECICFLPGRPTSFALHIARHNQETLT